MALSKPLRFAGVVGQDGGERDMMRYEAIKVSFRDVIDKGKMQTTLHAEKHKYRNCSTSLVLCSFDLDFFPCSTSFKQTLSRVYNSHVFRWKVQQHSADPADR
jgi:hypothetical protein